MSSCSLPADHDHLKPDCTLCPRLVEYRTDNQAQFPDKFNLPVPSFGEGSPALLIVGLAPGLKGANFTGRPFTGDYAGDLLYETLLEFGYATGSYEKHAEDGLTLIDSRITNAVRCVPPENKPIGSEVRNCLPYLENELELDGLKVILALGSLAHNAVLRGYGIRQGDHKFAHNIIHDLGDDKPFLVDSYHCSRYNTNTGRLTTDMFHDVFRTIKKITSDQTSK